MATSLEQLEKKAGSPNHGDKIAKIGPVDPEIIDLQGIYIFFK